MGTKKVRDSTSLIIYYLLIVNACCDIKLIVCDIHQMRQQSSGSSGSAVDFKINATQLEQHIMNGLNMKKKPDVNLVSVFLQYAQYFLKKCKCK